MPREPQLFSVPAGTPARQCGHCDLVVYWIFTPAGKRMPVDTSGQYGYPPSHPNAEPHAGRGISHFVTCPGADQARRSR